MNEGVRSRVVPAILDRVPGFVAARLRTGSSVTRLLRPAVNGMVGTGPTKVTVRSGQNRGTQLLIEPRSEKFYWTGLHESWVQDVIAASLRPGGVFWDVGAHIGFMSLLASRLVGPDGTVLAFEPAVGNCERLAENARLNGARNIIIEHCALGSHAGAAVLYRHRGSLTGTLVRERASGDDGEVVTCRTLDDVSVGSPLPDLIKIDVEGLELEVLRGGSRLLKRHHPQLLVEFSNDQLVHEAEGLLPGYSFRLVGKNHWLLT